MMNAAESTAPIATAQMVAIATLFSQGVFEHYFGMSSFGMDEPLIADILAGREEDLHGLTWKLNAMVTTWYAGLTLLWIAAGLTLITGADYLIKSVPFLKEDT